MNLLYINKLKSLTDFVHVESCAVFTKDSLADVFYGVVVVVEYFFDSIYLIINDVYVH